MIRVRLEIWVRFEKDLGKDFCRPSDPCSIQEREVEDGITVRDFFDRLAEDYEPIRERVFEREKRSFHPEIVVTLNDRVINPQELYDGVLKDGDKLTVLPVFMGG